MNTHIDHDQGPILVWDTDEIAKAQAEYLLENGDAAYEDDAFQMACADADVLDGEWTWLTTTLTALLDEINPGGEGWRVEVHNFGWRAQNGWKEFRAGNGRAFLREILPDTDCTFKVFVGPNNTVRIQNFHHDSPTGREWYDVTPQNPEAEAG